MLFLNSIDGKVNIWRQNFRDTRYNVDECEVCFFSSEVGTKLQNEKRHLNRINLYLNEDAKKSLRGKNLNNLQRFYSFLATTNSVS